MRILPRRRKPRPRSVHKIESVKTVDAARINNPPLATLSAHQTEFVYATDRHVVGRPPIVTLTCEIVRSETVRLADATRIVAT